MSTNRLKYSRGDVILVKYSKNPRVITWVNHEDLSYNVVNKATPSISLIRECVFNQIIVSYNTVAMLDNSYVRVPPEMFL